MMDGLPSFAMATFYGSFHWPVSVQIFGRPYWWVPRQFGMLLKIGKSDLLPQLFDPCILSRSAPVPIVENGCHACRFVVVALPHPKVFDAPLYL